MGLGVSSLTFFSQLDVCVGFHSVRVMKHEEYRREEIVELLLQGIERIKFEILHETRSEDDYPVSTTMAAELLSGGSGGMTDDRRPASGTRSMTVRAPKTFAKEFLTAEKWDSERVCRKRYKNGPSYSYKFILPGDEHFLGRPRSDREHVRLLFKLERRHRRDGGQGRPPHCGGVNSDAVASLSPLDHESFEAHVRSAYRELVGMTRGAAYVRIPELRKQMGAAEDTFQQGLLAMRDKGEVILSKHGYAASLSQEERDASIRVSPGEYYYYVTLRDEP